MKDSNIPWDCLPDRVWGIISDHLDYLDNIALYLTCYKIHVTVREHLFTNKRNVLDTPASYETVPAPSPHYTKDSAMYKMFGDYCNRPSRVLIQSPLTPVTAYWKTQHDVRFLMTRKINRVE